MAGQQIQEEIREVNGVKMRLTTYKVGNKFHCQIDSTNPGATVAKATNQNKEEAVKSALDKAHQRVIIKGKSL